MTDQAVSTRGSRRLFGADHRARLEDERPSTVDRPTSIGDSPTSIVDAIGAPRPHVHRAGDPAGLANMWQNAGMGLLRTIVDSTADHVHVKDLEGRYLLVNRADAELFGMTVDDILGLTDADIIDVGEAALVRERDLFVIETGEPLSYEQESTLEGVTRVWLTTKNVIRDPTGTISGIFTISHEVTEQRRQEAELRHAAKMDAVGQLAGGIAHDFNNMLTAILGYTSLVREGLSSEEEQARADLEQVTMAADRAAELTRQLLAFSRRQVLAPRVLDPVEIVRGIAPMLRRLLGEDIDLAIEGEPGAGQILVDPAQLEQVILNLALNARDAMPDGGRLLIETANADLDAEYVGNHPGVSAGPHVRLAVSDIGCGMDSATLERIFEPFFTTKDAGKGTGLGLSTVHGIVNQSGGWIYVYSEPGYGTTFHVYFPRVAGDAAQLPETSTGPVPRGGETILLVEDERAVRGFARRALGRLGYEVLEAGNGREAVALAAAYGGPIELLLTDVIMPGMHGAALSAELSSTRRGLRTLFVSGFPEDSIVRHGVLKDDVAYLPKPFSAAALGHSVRAVLDRRPAPGGPS